MFAIIKLIVEFKSHLDCFDCLIMYRLGYTLFTHKFNSLLVEGAII